MRTTTVKLDPQRTDRPVGVRSMPHGRAVLLRKAPRQAAALGRKWNDADFYLVVPVACYSLAFPERLPFRQDFSLIQSLGNLSGNLESCVSLAQEIY
jgi:hypothetical protein